MPPGGALALNEDWLMNLSDVQQQWVEVVEAPSSELAGSPAFDDAQWEEEGGSDESDD